MSRKAFDTELRELIQNESSLIEFSDGQVWKVRNREILWDRLGSRLYDKDLDAAKELAVKVLSERDPKFELPPERRFSANLEGKTLTNSPELRANLAETLALLGNRYEALPNCTPGKPQATALLAVREVFADSDWQLWGTLDQLLPTLAEAAPKEFIRAVESALADPSEPFDELFSQEGNDLITGGIYITGLLWGLEALAWDEDLLSKVCVVLAELAEHDPGGSWSNRPGNSIAAILLPWYPQTFASIEKRFAAMRAVIKDSPDVGWRVLLELLPNGMSTTSGTHKAKWRNPVPDDWKPNVTGAEHFTQVEQYASMAVELASKDFRRLCELVDNLDNLPKGPFEAALELLNSEDVANLDVDQKSELWRELTKFTNKHRRFTDAKWALPPEHVEKVERVAAILQPDDPRQKHRRLFSHSDSDLYEEHESYEDEQKKLTEKRIQAVKELLNQGGLETLLEFARNVEAPHNLGRAAAGLASVELDNQLLPDFLISSDQFISLFVANYVFHRYCDDGDFWLDGLDRQKWQTSQLCALLMYLPFDQPAWVRLDDWLGESKSDYWREVTVSPYQASSNLEDAIEKLLENDRPNAAIECLSRQLHQRQSLNVGQAVSALLGSLSSGEAVLGISQHHIVELISFLQKDDSVPEQDLASIEWGFLRLLQSYNKATPELLMTKLATEPEFFCEMIRLIYKSRMEDAEPVEVEEKGRRVASQAWNLLHKWNQPPGVGPNEEVDEQVFSNWLTRVQEISKETGHFEVSMINVGEVLFYTPSDPDGFWINRVVADTLNQRGSEDMRSGFQTQIHNSRGARWVDPTGTPERELANDWRVKAEATEQEGLARLADMLRDVAAFYEEDAERIVREHLDSNLPA